MPSLARRLASALCLSFSLAEVAVAATIWDEGVNGDLSNDRSSPTLVTLSVGTNTITGTVSPGNNDYFRFNVPTGTAFTQLILSGYSPANAAFLGIESGTQVTVDPAAPTAAPLLGWVHPDVAHLGTDILDDMAAGAGAIGFTAPLGPGDYSFWMQQFNAVTSYSFDVVVVPEPGTASLLLLGLGGLALVRRRN